MLGFPAISAGELERCRALVRVIEHDRLPIVPRFLARALVTDLEPIIALQDSLSTRVEADCFIGTSPIRRRVERWDLETVLAKVADVGRYLATRKLAFGLSIEDATRTPPDELAEILEVALASGPRVITICDTVGEASPEGTQRLVHFVRDQVERIRVPVTLWWHGHNDRGLALVNALAAVEAGVDGISGAFLGLGERTGNTALEQVIMYAAQHGNRRFLVDRLVAHCRAWSRYTDTPIPRNTPLVGSQAFATSTGTHSAAILKARVLGIDFEDLIFSSVPASRLGRSQEILIGPTSGLANARHLLETLRLEVTDENAQKLVRHAKQQDRLVAVEDILTLIGTPA
jgi:2-isopropylmalate synthase